MTKYHDEEWLGKRLEEMSVQAIADECGVQKETIQKWRKKLSVGERYECDFCDEDFPTKRGRNIHHKKSHDVSTGGFTYECQNPECGEEFESPRPPSDPMAPSFCGQECYGESISGDRNPNKDPERRKKIGRGLKKSYEDGDRIPGYRNPIEVEETGHIVDSSWEAEVDKLLHRMNIDYEYNGSGEYKRYSIDGFSHAPDFVIPGDDEIVLEVKGHLAIHFQKEKMEAIAQKMSGDDDLIYIVYGDVDIPCDYHIDYGHEDDLRKILQKLCQKRKRRSLFHY